MSSIEKAKKLAEKYCDEETLRHTKLVVKYALILGKEYDANLEVVELAAWLHDIGRYDMDNDQHSKRSVELSAELLANHPKRESIEQAILKHGGKYVGQKNPIEVDILLCADGVALFYDEERIARKLHDGSFARMLEKKKPKSCLLPLGKKLYEERVEFILQD